jgi:long-chain acyl-CoA synthetase
MSGRIISGEREITQDELMARVARAAGGFASLGIGENDAVALMLRNDFPFIEASMAAPAVGAYAVPINWHFTAEEAGYILGDCTAKALVVHSDMLARIADGIPASTRVFVVPTPPEVRAAYALPDATGAPATEAQDWEAWVAAQEARGEPPIGARDSMIYTSGTTGRPKGVRRQPQGPEAAERLAKMVATVFDIRPGGGMRTVVAGPMYHAAPNAYGLAAARDGGLVVLQPRFEAEELLRLVERHRISHLHMVPTMFVRLLKLPDEVKARYDLSSLEFVIHAAAPCPPDVKRRMIEWWGPIINEYYGSTETGAVIFHTSAEALRKPGTVGRPIEGGVVRIVGAQGRALPAGEIGEVYLWLHGLSDFTYHGHDDKRADIDIDGLVTVGDVGYLDEDGYLFLCDRKNDMVISGGVNIYPAEIEAALVGMPGVHDCAVFGIPDDEFGERLCAYVEPEPGAALEADTVRDFLRGHLADYKIPKLVEFRAELPREDSGKIFKRKLREPYWAETGRRI